MKDLDYTRNYDAATVLVRRLEIFYKDFPDIKFWIEKRPLFIEDHEVGLEYDIRSNLSFKCS